MVLIEKRGRKLPFEFEEEGATMSPMATRLRNSGFAVLLGLCANSAFAQTPTEFINDASAKGVAEIEASRLAHQKAESKEVKDYTIVVIKRPHHRQPASGENRQATGPAGGTPRRSRGEGQDLDAAGHGRRDVR